VLRQPLGPRLLAETARPAAADRRTATLAPRAGRVASSLLLACSVPCNQRNQQRSTDHLRVGVHNKKKSEGKVE
jgi:hypothetical protein